MSVTSEIKRYAIFHGDLSTSEVKLYYSNNISEVKVFAIQKKLKPYYQNNNIRYLLFKKNLNNIIKTTLSNRDGEEPFSQNKK